jgi:hypothetical protein
LNTTTKGIGVTPPPLKELEACEKERVSREKNIDKNIKQASINQLRSDMFTENLVRRYSQGFDEERNEFVRNEIMWAKSNGNEQREYERMAEADYYGFTNSAQLGCCAPAELQRDWNCYDIHDVLNILLIQYTKFMHYRLRT